MRVAYNDKDDRAGLRGYVQFNKYTHTHTHKPHINSGCGKREEHKKWSTATPEKAAPVTVTSCPYNY